MKINLIDKQQYTRIVEKNQLFMYYLLPPNLQLSNKQLMKTPMDITGKGLTSTEQIDLYIHRIEQKKINLLVSNLGV